MSIAKLKIGIVGALIAAGVATPLVWQQLKLQRENQALREQLAGQVALAAENQRLTQQLEQQSLSQTNRNKEQAELLRLRGEVTRLRKENQDQQKALATKSDAGKKAAVWPPGAGVQSDEQGRMLRVQMEKNQALDASRAALAAQGSGNGNGNNSGPPPNGAIALSKDADGKPHMMQFNDGQWQEVDPGTNFTVTPEGAVAFTLGTNAITLGGQGQPQGQYSVIISTNANK